MVVLGPLKTVTLTQFVDSGFMASLYDLAMAGDTRESHFPDTWSQRVCGNSAVYHMLFLSHMVSFTNTVIHPFSRVS